MAVVHGGRPVQAVRWITEDGEEKIIVQIRWVDAHGVDHLVWDGTMPAFVEAGRATGAGAVTAPTVSAGQRLAIPVVGSADGEVLDVTVSAGARLGVPVAAGSGAVAVPVVSGGARIAMPHITGSGLVRAPLAGEFTDSDVNVPMVTGEGEVYAPTVQVPVDLEITAASGVGEVLIPVVRAGGAAVVPVVTGSGSVSVPVVTAGQSITVPPAAGSGLVRVPVVAVPAAVSVPIVTGSGVVNVPVVKNGESYTDLFNRASLGSDWGVYSPLPVISGSTKMQAGSLSFGQQALCTPTYAQALTSNNQSVSITLAAPTGTLNTNGGCVFGGYLRATGAADSGTMVAFQAYGSTAVIASKSGATFTQRATNTLGSAVTSGDVFEFRAVSNGYTLYRNGLVACSWLDSGNLMAVGSSNLRGGAIVMSAYNANTSYQLQYSMAIDEFTLKDI
ncbi:hypothetical protein ACKAMS_22820 [Rhodococcus sp. 5A-K4]|uniref:hypothetical protein n=1 Tax=Rhodococcus sp. 5A-K4 TaxID=3384442 RepID=UPI0038D501A7